MNTFFIGVGHVEVATVKPNGNGQSFMFHSGRDCFYISAAQAVPAAEALILGRLYSYRARACGHLHVGVRPLLVVDLDQVNQGTISDLVVSWVIDCLRVNKD